jgi:ribosomal protein L11 methyltransferase
VVPAAEAEALVARVLELVPAGHELVERDGDVELAVYVERRELARLERALPGLASTAVDPGWPEAWRRFHRGVAVGPLWLGPPWDEPPAGRPAVVIDPGQAFGTGAHATTRLCIELLDGLERGSLLDAGCGSGVVAIAAARLGFAPVTAVDVDPAAVEATRSNAAANQVTLDVQLRDVRERTLPERDVAVANIELATVEALAGRVRASLLVLSGYVETACPAVRGWRHLARRSEAGWASDSYARE